MVVTFTNRVEAVSQPLILRGERSGLQTHIATTENVSSEANGIDLGGNTSVADIAAPAMR